MQFHWLAIHIRTLLKSCSCIYHILFFCTWLIKLRWLVCSFKSLRYYIISYNQLLRCPSIVHLCYFRVYFRHTKSHKEGKPRQMLEFWCFFLMSFDVRCCDFPQLLLSVLIQRLMMFTMFVYEYLKEEKSIPTNLQHNRKPFSVIIYLCIQICNYVQCLSSCLNIIALPQMIYVH